MKNYLGQNFLINSGKIKEIVEALNLKPNETIIEIGAGHGEISGELVNWGIRELVSIEKDKLLTDSLQKKYAKNKKIKIIRGDALKILPKLIIQFPNSLINYKLIGNIPFYITGRLLRIISELKIKPELAVFIIQKEVGQRIIAKPPRMNLLAASVQFWAEPKIIGYISKKEFKPQPEVDGAIIRLTTASGLQTTAKNSRYYQLIKILFKQPRKTILNNLIFNYQLSIFKHEIIKKLAKIGINPQDRPQNLSIEQLRRLSTLF